jgi:5-methylcytosine-specific restriction protein A
MPGRWAGSSRRARLPSNWRAIRAAVLRRDGHQCTWVHDGQRCTQQAIDVDHRDRQGGDHPANLRSLCTTHHSKKSAAEGNQVRWQHRETRPKEQHPGLK